MELDPKIREEDDEEDEMMRSQQPEEEPNSSAALVQGNSQTVSPFLQQRQSLQNMRAQQSISPAFGSQTSNLMSAFHSFPVPVTKERDHDVSHPGLNMQNMHLPQTDFPVYGNAGSNYKPLSTSSKSTRLPPTSLQSVAGLKQESVDQSNKQPQLSSMHALTSMWPRKHETWGAQQSISPAFGSHTSNSMLAFSSLLVPVTKERDHGVPIPGLNMQNRHLPHTAFLGYGSSGSNYKPLSTSSTSTWRPPISLQSLAGLKHESVDQSNKQHQLSSMHAPTSLSSIEHGNVAPCPPDTMPQSGTDDYARKAPPRKLVVGKKTPMRTLGSSVPSRKRQKVSVASGGSLEQSMNLLNDVVSVSGLNLMEEEEHLLSGSKEDSRISEISQCAAQEKEEKLFLQKIPLQKKVAEIMAKSGLESMDNDVERCLSMCVEERMCTLIGNLIRLSKQRVDTEKLNHKIIVTSDIGQQLLKNCQAHEEEELENKQSETERLLKPTDAKKEKNYVVAANVVVRAATGCGDMLSRWQEMVENKQKRGGADTASSAYQLDPSHAASVSKARRDEVDAPSVARSITVNDVIAVLERDPKMSKSTLLYRLFERMSD